MPPATHLQGWFPVPEELHHFRALLDALPPVQQGFVVPPERPAQSEQVHYFTDGACMRPKDRFARICAWGVVRAQESDLWTFTPVASGCLPGRLQTVVRAELLAATAAVFDATRNGSPFAIWVDNARVVKLMQQMMLDPTKQWPSKVPNHDLINDLADAMREASPLCRGVYKVVSHQQTTDNTPVAEQWCFTGNDRADALASQAFQSQPALLQCWNVLCQKLDEYRALRDALHTMLVSIGLECLQHTAKMSVPAPAPPPVAQALEMQSWLFPDPLPVEAAPYLLPETEPVRQWLVGLHDTTLPVQRWSWWQLFLDAWLSIPAFGPWYHANQHRWKSGSAQPAETFQRKARWFSQYMTKLTKACRMDLPLQHKLPNGTAIAFWTKTLPVCAAPERTARLDNWFGQYFCCATKTSDLRRINM